jgi:hypothetical protein
MSAGQATLAVAPTQLVPLQRVVLSLPITTDARRVAHNQLVVAIDRALEARRALSKSAIDPFRLTTLFLVAATTLAAMGCVQADRLRRAATAMALLATGMAIALTPLVAQAAPSRATSPSAPICPSGAPGTVTGGCLPPWTSTGGRGARTVVAPRRRR